MNWEQVEGKWEQLMGSGVAYLFRRKVNSVLCTRKVPL